MKEKEYWVVQIFWEKQPPPRYGYSMGDDCPRDKGYVLYEDEKMAKCNIQLYTCYGFNNFVEQAKSGRWIKVNEEIYWHSKLGRVSRDIGEEEGLLEKFLKSEGRKEPKQRPLGFDARANSMTARQRLGGWAGRD